ncbi:MAG: hypothetical protein AVDCRST_MAG91-1626, partial [uncultured Sphingomonadaceae bacterium]
PAARRAATSTTKSASMVARLTRSPSCNRRITCSRRSVAASERRSRSAAPRI